MFMTAVPFVSLSLCFPKYVQDTIPYSTQPTLVAKCTIFSTFFLLYILLYIFRMPIDILRT